MEEKKKGENGHAEREGGLGFRDLESFNMALLAKQGWRLLKSPESLAATIFKEKYYRHSSFLDAKLSSLPYLMWRSIWLVMG